MRWLTRVLREVLGWVLVAWLKLLLGFVTVDVLGRAAAVWIKVILLGVMWSVIGRFQRWISRK